MQVSTSMSGFLMGIPSVTYIIAAPIGGWLGEVVGYRPVLFMGACGCFCCFFQGRRGGGEVMMMMSMMSFCV